MPAPLRVDWSVAQLLFQEGLPLTSIAKRTGIPYPGLAKRAKRYGWQQLIPDPSVPQNTAKLSDRWQSRILDATDRHLSTVLDKSKPKVSLDSLEKLARILDITDRTARRTLGLDISRSDQHVTLHVQSEVAQSKAQPEPSQIVDVETVSSVSTQDTAQPEPDKSSETPTNPT